MQENRAVSYSDKNPSMRGHDGKTPHKDSVYLKPPEIKLNRVSGWDSRLSNPTIFVNNRNQVVLRGKTDSSYKVKVQYIRIVERQIGSTLVDITSKCKHRECYIADHPVDPSFLLEACNQCQELEVTTLTLLRVKPSIRDGNH